MNHHEFQALRDLPDKQVRDDIRFSASRDNHHSLTFNKMVVHNTDGWTVMLNGTYKPGIGTISFNFVVQEAGGPVCRIDVNGTIHKNAGRTHKHDLTHDDDPRNNLPHAVARPDLVGKTAQQVWDELCQQAQITHLGTFHPPEQEAQA